MHQLADHCTLGTSVRYPAKARYEAELALSLHILQWISGDVRALMVVCERHRCWGSSEFPASWLGRSESPERMRRYPAAAPLWARAYPPR